MNLTGIANRLTQRLSNFRNESPALKPTELPTSQSKQPNKQTTGNKPTSVIEYLIPSSLTEQEYLSKVIPALKKELTPNLEKALFLTGQFHQKHSTVQPAIVVQNLFLNDKPSRKEAKSQHNFHSIHLFKPQIDPSSSQPLPVQLLNQTISSYSKRAQMSQLHRPQVAQPSINFLR